MSIKKFVIGQPDLDSNKLFEYRSEEDAEKKCKNSKWEIVMAMNLASSMYKFRNPYKSKAVKPNK